MELKRTHFHRHFTEKIQALWTLEIHVISHAMKYFLFDSLTLLLRNVKINLLRKWTCRPTEWFLSPVLGGPFLESLHSRHLTGGWVLCIFAHMHTHHSCWVVTWVLTASHQYLSSTSEAFSCCDFPVDSLMLKVTVCPRPIPKASHNWDVFSLIPNVSARCHHKSVGFYAWTSSVRTKVALCLWVIAHTFPITWKPQRGWGNHRGAPETWCLLAEASNCCLSDPLITGQGLWRNFICCPTDLQRAVLLVDFLDSRSSCCPLHQEQLSPDRPL